MSRIEQQMIELWQNILGSKTIGLNDDFFSHGGHSLLALKMIDRINKTFHCSLSPNQLYKTPSIKSLIQEIECSNGHDNDDIVVPMKIINQSSPFLFLFHPINGLLFSFNSFVSESNLNLSIFGIQDPGTKKNEFTFTQFTDIANTYLQSIIKTQPKGPYFFLGYSFGGNICYEIASLLQKRGEIVALLGMIDSWAIHPLLSKERSIFESFMNVLHPEPNLVPSDLAWKRQEILLKHDTSHTSQKIILFKAKELLAEYQPIDNPTNGWSIYTDNSVICYEIAGNHHSIMEPNSIRIISNLLKKHL